MNTLSRAAIYVRMSKDSQNYSTDHQRAAIAIYAAAVGLEIVAEYSDEGRSGLDIKGRLGLQRLMDDVRGGVAEFSTIIVYDVSRWGRFQDVDEAAYHEHTCRRANIAVVYCAEQFENDGSPLASLLKSIKRTMAAEYSRELSSKVFAAQCRFFEMGFKQGGHAGYGLRRLALTAEGTPRRILKYNESKGSVTDRVVLVIGPEHEVAMVRRMYGLYLDDGLSEAAIARLLNVEGVASEFDRPWTQAMVNSVLTNVKYIGDLVFNRRSCKLSKPRTHNARVDWIVKKNAIEGLLPRRLFQQAQEERVRRNRRYSSLELIQLLKECYQRHGNVTSKIIAADDALPDPQLFTRMFGSLVRAYDAAELPRSRLHGFVDTKRILLSLRHRLFHDATALSINAGGIVTMGVQKFSFVINGFCTVRVEVATRRNPRRGSPCWKICPHADADFTLVGRMASDGYAIEDFYLIPLACFDGRPIYLKERNFEIYSPLSFSCLEQMFGMTGH